MSYFWVFGCKCYIYKKRQYLGKFQRRCDVGFMVGYSASSKVYRVYNESTGIVEETYDVEFDESNQIYGGIDGDEDDIAILPKKEGYEEDAQRRNQAPRGWRRNS